MGNHRDRNYVATVIEHLTAGERREAGLLPDDYAAIFELKKQGIALEFALEFQSRNLRDERGEPDPEASKWQWSHVVSLECAESLRV